MSLPQAVVAAIGFAPVRGMTVAVGEAVLAAEATSPPVAGGSAFAAARHAEHELPQPEIELRRDARGPTTMKPRPADEVARPAGADHAYPVITQRLRARRRQTPCRTRGYVSVSAS